MEVEPGVAPVEPKRTQCSEACWSSMSISLSFMDMVDMYMVEMDMVEMDMVEIFMLRTFLAQFGLFL